jgi:hypothetical protein
LQQLILSEEGTAMKSARVFAALAFCSAAFAEQNYRKIDVYNGGGLLPQVVDSSEWKTTIYFHNGDSSAINAALLFLDDKGDPMSLPVNGKSAPGGVFALSPGDTTVLETDGTGPLKQGYALVLTCDRPCSESTSKAVYSKLGFYAVVRQRVQDRTDSEAVVPAEMPEKSVRILFDNRSGYSTGLALVNFMGGNIAITIRDQNANVLAADMLQIPQDAKSVFVLADKYRATAGKYGSIELSGSGLAAMGLRFSPGGSFTSSHAITMR